MTLKYSFNFIFWCVEGGTGGGKKVTILCRSINLDYM